jgi:hypothetical protein
MKTPPDRSGRSSGPERAAGKPLPIRRGGFACPPCLLVWLGAAVVALLGWLARRFF